MNVLGEEEMVEENHLPTQATLTLKGLIRKLRKASGPSKFLLPPGLDELMEGMKEAEHLVAGAYRNVWIVQTEAGPVVVKLALDPLGMQCNVNEYEIFDIFSKTNIALAKVLGFDKEFHWWIVMEYIPGELSADSVRRFVGDDIFEVYFPKTLIDGYLYNSDCYTYSPSELFEYVIECRNNNKWCSDMFELFTMAKIADVYPRNMGVRVDGTPVVLDYGNLLSGYTDSDDVCELRKQRK